MIHDILCDLESCVNSYTNFERMANNLGLNRSLLLLLQFESKARQRFRKIFQMMKHCIEKGFTLRITFNLKVV